MILAHGQHQPQRRAPRAGRRIASHDRPASRQVEIGSAPSTRSTCPDGSELDHDHPVAGVPRPAAVLMHAGAHAQPGRHLGHDTGALTHQRDPTAARPVGLQSSTGRRRRTAVRPSRTPATASCRAVSGDDQARNPSFPMPATVASITISGARAQLLSCVVVIRRRRGADVPRPEQEAAQEDHHGRRSGQTDQAGAQRGHERLHRSRLPQRDSRRPRRRDQGRPRAGRRVSDRPVHRRVHRPRTGRRAGRGRRRQFSDAVPVRPDHAPQDQRGHQ